jgi:hypothetical protein
MLNFQNFRFTTYARLLAANVLGLCEGGGIEVQMFNLAQMLIRIPMLKFSKNAPLLQNPVIRRFVFSFCLICFQM